MGEVILKRTKRVNTVLAIRKEGDRQIIAFKEVLYTDTGKSGKYLFSAKISWKDTDKIPDSIAIEVKPTEV